MAITAPTTPNRPLRQPLALLASTALVAALLAACSSPPPPAPKEAAPKPSSSLGVKPSSTLSLTEQLERLAPAPRLRLPDPLQAAQDALDEEARSTARPSDQQGIASWYGGKFHGRRTASGERFDRNDFTAAHRSYAFGTKLCVVHLRSGNSVIVRVNDRGPFAHQRILDLSEAAAHSLGLRQSGTGKIQLWKLEEDEDTCPTQVAAG